MNAVFGWIVLLLLVSQPAAAVPHHPTRARGAIYALGDLHGDLAAAKTSLRLAHLIDSYDSWSGGNVTLVQLGDVFDRGPDGKAIVEYFEKLAAEAESANGKVVQLLGNHELMNIMGHFDYVHPADTRAFGGHAKRVEAFSELGWLGKILRARDIVHISNRTVFVHAGLVEHWAKLGAAQINKQFHQLVNSRSWRHELLGSTGPVWDRSVVGAAKRGNCAPVTASLHALSEAMQADDPSGSKEAALPLLRMVVGHTIQSRGRIGVFCGGAMIAIDTAISSFYNGGLPSLLEISLGGERVTPLHARAEVDDEL